MGQQGREKTQKIIVLRRCESRASPTTKEWQALKLLFQLIGTVLIAEFPIVTMALAFQTASLGG